MKTKALVDVLTKHEKCTFKDGVIEVSEETDVALYTSLGQEAMALTEIRRITISEQLLVAENRKGETYAILAEDLRALRIGKSPTKRRSGLV